MWIYPEAEPKQLPSLVLAYVGDAVFELYVRTYLVSKGIAKTNRLHGEACNLVKAASQAQFYHQLEGLLSEEEKEVAKRGRNAKGNQIPRHAEIVDYKLSTGFEALVGYLFLMRREDRITELLEYLFEFQKA